MEYMPDLIKVDFVARTDVVLGTLETDQRRLDSATKQPEELAAWKKATRMVIMCEAASLRLRIRSVHISIQEIRHCKTFILKDRQEAHNISMASLRPVDHAACLAKSARTSPKSVKSLSTTSKCCQKHALQHSQHSEPPKPRISENRLLLP